MKFKALLRQGLFLWVLIDGVGRGYRFEWVLRLTERLILKRIVEVASTVLTGLEAILGDNGRTKNITTIEMV
ncbi:hypothetical protein F971_01914 [Acinetobacter vivianii]|jgi:hypothetical protein|uniref:Uncharacterized protein n=1 Tax=Acinetobacter vivianii TaxID=1776742 RepID=N8WC95_9GAMM|nr:hypothetical protein F971_01914 [Acinetobacter vivianii]